MRKGQDVFGIKILGNDNYLDTISVKKTILIKGFNPISHTGQPIFSNIQELYNLLYLTFNATPTAVES